MQRADAPIFWERCEANATVTLDLDKRGEFDIWKIRHPRAIISLYPQSANGVTYLCDKHDELMQEVLS